MIAKFSCSTVITASVCDVAQVYNCLHKYYIYGCDIFISIHRKSYTSALLYLRFCYNVYTIIDKVVLAVAFNSKALKLPIDKIFVDKLIFDIKDLVT